MSKCTITIWGRVFELPVIYQHYTGEDVLESQKDAFSMLESDASEVSGSLVAVKQYVYQNNANQLAEDRIENIFKYVIPVSIFVPHMKTQHVAAILCNYKFDMEHGIAVVFESGKFKEIGAQDIVL